MSAMSTDTQASSQMATLQVPPAGHSSEATGHSSEASSVDAPIKESSRLSLPDRCSSKLINITRGIDDFLANSQTIPQKYGMKSSREYKSRPVQCDWMHGFTTHWSFRLFIHTVILCSAIQMGLAVDIHSRHWIDAWTVCEFLFTVIFVVEMVLKLIALGFWYFHDYWNILDFIVACASVVDAWVMPSFYEAGDQPSYFKMFRMFRLLRIVKMLRVVPELMLVVEGIMQSLRSMFWVFLLLALILYTVSIYCVEVIGNSDSGYAGRVEAVTEITEAVVDPFNNFLYFGSVTRSMVSLFSVVLLAEWSPIVRPVWEKQPGMVIVFIFLVVLTTFGVLNVIIGVVVERTTAVMNQVRQHDVTEKKNEQMKAIRLIQELMFDLDTDNDRLISKEEMEQGASNEKLQDLLSRVDLPQGFTYGELHSMLDQDGSGLLSKKEFLHGMLRMVYNDTFQRDCLSALTMGQIKANQHRLHGDLKKDIKKVHADIKKDFNTLRLQLGIISSTDGLSFSTETFEGGGFTLAPGSGTQTTATRSKAVRVVSEPNTPVGSSMGAQESQNARIAQERLLITPSPLEGWQPLDPQLNGMLLVDGTASPVRCPPPVQTKNERGPPDALKDLRLGGHSCSLDEINVTLDGRAMEDAYRREPRRAGESLRSPGIHPGSAEPPPASQIAAPTEVSV